MTEEQLSAEKERLEKLLKEKEGVKEAMELREAELRKEWQEHIAATRAQAEELMKRQREDFGHEREDLQVRSRLYSNNLSYITSIAVTATSQ